jgi:hypothetical protein
MSSLYSVWDIVSCHRLLVPRNDLLTKRQCDDLILRKVNSSDASVFAQRYGGSSQCWGIVWSIVSVIFMVAGIIAGIAAFPESFAEQETDSEKILPTR